MRYILSYITHCTHMSATTTWHGVCLRWAYADLLRGIQRKTGCAQRARDILHDALVRFALVSGRKTVDEPHAYLRTTVRSVLVDQFRDEARWIQIRGVDGEQDGMGLDPEFEPVVPSAEHMADLWQRLEALQALFDGLPPRRREVFWLFRVEGYRQAEIAAKLGISQTMVERHVMRALIDLHAAYIDFA